MQIKQNYEQKVQSIKCENNVQQSIKYEKEGMTKNNFEFILDIN
jgi:hypothetical protein